MKVEIRSNGEVITQHNHDGDLAVMADAIVGYRNGMLTATVNSDAKRVESTGFCYAHIRVDQHVIDSDPYVSPATLFIRGEWEPMTVS